MAYDKKKLTALIKRAVQDESWDAVMFVLDEHLKALNEEPVTGSNEFETLRSLHVKQGKIEGIKEFMEKLEKGEF